MLKKSNLLGIVLISSFLICRSTSWSIRSNDSSFAVNEIDQISYVSNAEELIVKVKRDNSINTEYQRRNDELLPSPTECGPIVPILKVLGGEEAQLGEIPWLVNLEYKKGDRLVIACAGNIINRRYILTAAHCLRGSLGPVVSVRVGDHNIETAIDCNEDGCIDAFQRINVENNIIHPDYRIDEKKREYNDIALLRTDHDIQYSSSVAPVCLPDAVPYLPALTSGRKLTVAGWGRTSKNFTSATKQKLRIPFVDRDDCMLPLAHGQLCAGGVPNQDSCNGDSGGSLARPTQYGWFLVGLVSYGWKCGTNEPSIYTNVTTYMDWIHNTIKA